MRMYLYVMLPKKLQAKLDLRSAANALRKLSSSFSEESGENVDFSSNDYLGYSKNQTIFFRASEILEEHQLQQNGATGSRLLSGNHKLYRQAEDFIAQIHQVEASLIFNSGYDANVGFFSSVPQRSDVILYDEFIHASIRDGIQMSNAKAYKFKHNDLEDLEAKLSLRAQSRSAGESAEFEIYMVTESVFSMDGDSPNLQAMADLSKKHGANLIVDEAHALGVFNFGLIHQLGLQNCVFAILVTFGKAMGCHGAAILGSNQLKSYLVNFARSLIYTTGLPPHSVATILASYEHMEREVKKPQSDIIRLDSTIQFFREEVKNKNLQAYFISSDSAIQCAIISGNDTVKRISLQLKKAGFDVKAILSPTISAGQERLRFCLHSYNSQNEILNVLELLSKSLKGFSAD